MVGCTLPRASAVTALSEGREGQLQAPPAVSRPPRISAAPRAPGSHKSRDITLLTKVRIVKAMVFPAVMYGCERWTIKKVEHWRIDAFELWCWISIVFLISNPTCSLQVHRKEMTFYILILNLAPHYNHFFQEVLFFLSDIV